MGYKINKIKLREVGINCKRKTSEKMWKENIRKDIEEKHQGRQIQNENNSEDEREGGGKHQGRRAKQKNNRVGTNNRNTKIKRIEFSPSEKSPVCVAVQQTPRLLFST